MKKNERPPFCFLHIPKTGGVTFHNILIDQYSGEKRMSLVSKEQSKVFFDLPAEEKKDYKLVKGHFWFDFEHFSPTPDSVYFTFLRKPISRTVSHYWFLFQNPRHWFYKEMMANNYSLLELYKNGKVLNLDNCMVRFLCGNIFKPWGEIDETDLAVAKNNFDKHFQHFGINEYYDESLLILANQLGWKPPYYARLNQGTKKKKEPFDIETQELMVRYNAMDEKLYAYALEKFKIKLKENSALLEKQLPAFREKNKTYWTWRVWLYKYVGSDIFK